MPLFMIRNDITKMQVDAIVNPSNPELHMGRGTSWAIYNAAGEIELTNECRKIGSCEVGKAVLTKGFALPAKFIIHAVCPTWKDGKEQDKAYLKNAYHSALQIAAECGFQSIAFPLLSSGFYRWPKAQAFHLATTAISEFLLEHEMIVYLVLYDHESVEVSKKLYSNIEEYIDDHYVETKEEGYSHQKSTIRCNSLQSDDAIACYASYFGEPEKSVPCSSNISDKSKVPDFLKKPTVPKGRNLDELVSCMDETFSQMLLRIIDERELKDSVVYHKANIDRRLFSKIRNNVNYTPTKKTALAFAIALELSLDETKDLLMKAGYALSNSSKFDIILSFFIENRNYNIFEINEVLFFYEQPILGE